MHSVIVLQFSIATVLTAHLLNATIFYENSRANLTNYQCYRSKKRAHSPPRYLPHHIDNFVYVRYLTVAVAILDFLVGFGVSLVVVSWNVLNPSEGEN